MGGLWPNTQGSNQENWYQGQGNQGRNYGNYNREGQYVLDWNNSRYNKFNKGNNGNRINKSGPYIPPQNQEVARKDGGGSMAQV